MKLRILAAGFTQTRARASEIASIDINIRHIWLRNQNYENVTNLVMLDDA